MNLIEQGSKLLDESLDIKSLVKMKNQVDLMIRIMFSKQQRWLIKNQSKENFKINEDFQDSNGLNKIVTQVNLNSNELKRLH